MKDGITGEKWPVNFACDFDFHVNPGFFDMPRKSATWETDLLPPQGRHAVDFFARSWVPEASMLTTRPPKPLVYGEIISKQASQLNERRNSPETGKENMQVCPAMTHSRLKTRSPWIQDSESSVLVSHIFRRLANAEKQSTACTASAATRHNSVTTGAAQFGRGLCVT